MDFDQGTSEDSTPKLEEMYENLANITKQLAILQGFMESKFGHEFTSFCQFSESSAAYTSVVDTTSIQEDAEEYDKMPNLVSEESPSRTLGFVTVPLRQTSSGASLNKPQSPMQTSNSCSVSEGATSKRDRGSMVKEENELEAESDNDDMMYPLHNLSDLLEGTGGVDGTETPEFLELELDPSTLLRGEPPALQPMFASTNHGQNNQQQHCLNNNNSSTGHSSAKRSSSRQSTGSFHRYDVDVPRSTPVAVARRASVGSPDNNPSYKKFDCHICGIKFEFAETLKTHLESHAGARNIRSNSEDQPAVGSNLGAIPLPRLMPRPLIPIAGSVSADTSEDDGVTAVKVSKSSKKKSSHISTSSSSSSLTSSKSLAAMKRRKRYNQSRPCALKCPECNLPIRDKSRLIEHLRGHTGERPFECSVCEKAYTRRDVLKTHMLKMHGIAPEFPSS